MTPIVAPSSIGAEGVRRGRLGRAALGFGAGAVREPQDEGAPDARPRVQRHRGAGIPLPELSAPYTAFVQLLGGVLLIVGGLTRIVLFGLLVVMLGAVYFVHLEEGFLGYAYPLFLAVACVALVLTGPGRYSLDHRIVSRLTAEPAPARDAAATYRR
ncbi:MAG: DoxX family protein [Stackebrandtia sp.]